jgi:hypothetical protein
MPAVRVVDEHLLAPVLVYSGSGGVFDNELVLSTTAGLTRTIQSGSLDLGIDFTHIPSLEGADFAGPVKFNGGLTGSLQSLPSGDPYIIGKGVLAVTTSSIGQVEIHADIDSITAQVAKKYVNEIVFNERILIPEASNGIHFNLASTPTNVSEVQLWLNGQLLTYGEDYSVSDRLITILPSPLRQDDKLIASYSRALVMKQYKFGERLTLQLDGAATLQNAPTSNNDVMIFLNGQLLLRGIMLGDNDYHINGQIITFNNYVDSTDVLLASYSY